MVTHRAGGRGAVNNATSDCQLSVSCFCFAKKELQATAMTAFDNHGHSKPFPYAQTLI